MKTSIKEYTIRSFEEMGVKMSDGNPWKDKEKDAILPMESDRERVNLDNMLFPNIPTFNPEDIQFGVDLATKEDYGCRVKYVIKDGINYILNVEYL